MGVVGGIFVKKVSNNKSNKNVRHRDSFSLIVLALSFVLGAVLIGFGIYNNINSAYNQSEIMTEDEAKAQVREKIDKVNELRDKRDEEYDKSAYSEEYANLSRQITIAEGDLNDTEAELYNITSGFYDGMKADKIWSSVPLIVAGAALIVVGIGLYMRMNSSKKKNMILTVTEE
jgi:hypothetical protein